MVGRTYPPPPHPLMGLVEGVVEPYDPWDATGTLTEPLQSTLGVRQWVCMGWRPSCVLGRFCASYGVPCMTQRADSPVLWGWHPPDPRISLHRRPRSEDGGWCVSPYCLGTGLRPRASLCVYLGSEPKLSLRNLIRLARASEDTYSPFHSLMYHLATSPAT